MDTSEYRKAETVEFDPISGDVIVNFDNVTSFTFPARRLQGLELATDAQLSEVEIAGGSGLHWPTLDADFSIDGLMRGVFGTAAFMAAARPRVDG